MPSYSRLPSKRKWSVTTPTWAVMVLLVVCWQVAHLRCWHLSGTTADLLPANTVSLSARSMQGTNTTIDLTAGTTTVLDKMPPSQQKVLIVMYLFGDQTLKKRSTHLCHRVGTAVCCQPCHLGHPPPSFALPPNAKFIHVTWNNLMD